jgi:hypothetical protein
VRAHGGSRGTTTRLLDCSRTVYRCASSRRRGDDRRQPLELLAPNRGLNVGHAVVEADHRVLLEDDAIGRVADRVRTRSCRDAAADESVGRGRLVDVVNMPPSPVESSLRG